MAGDYWRSSQAHHWLLSPYEVQLSRIEDIRYAGSDERLASVTIWMSNAISTLCKRLSLRQRVTATATVFFHRFYAIPPNGYCNTDPCLVASACVYVAAKVEETPLHVKIVMVEAGKMWKEFGHSGFPSSSSDLAEMEFYLLRDLDYHLVLYHPYRSLMAIAGSVGQSVIEKSAAGKRLEAKVAAMVAASERAKANAKTAAAAAASAGSSQPPPLGLGIEAESLGVGSSQLGEPSADMIASSSAGATSAANAAAAMRFQLEEELARAAMTMGDGDQPIARAAEIDEGVVQMAWFLLNDTYRHASLHLLYPPHILALAAIYLALVLREATRDKMLASAQRMQERRRLKGEADAAREEGWRRDARSGGGGGEDHAATTTSGASNAPAGAGGSNNPSAAAAGNRLNRPTNANANANPLRRPPATAATSPLTNANANASANSGTTAGASSNATTSVAASAAAAPASNSASHPASYPASHAPTPQPDILTFLASLNVSPTSQLAPCIQSILDGYAVWNRVQADIDGAEGNARVVKWMEEWRRSREEELRVLEMQAAAAATVATAAAASGGDAR